jgi:16S rRNA G966 N2-methylase RsmD
LEKKPNQLIDALSSGPVRQYILDHENDDIREIILKHKEVLGIPTAQLLEQIVTRRKAKEKLPLYYQTPGIIFPPPENFEQSSSEVTALLKSELIHNLMDGTSAVIADLTSGFGVDAYFLSTIADKIHVVEPDRSLADLAQHNHQLLGAHNIEYHISTAESFLHATDIRFDLIYADPSRRTVERKKIRSFEESQPDILKLQNNMFDKSSLLLIKASPLLDIQAGISQLVCVKKVFVISVSNECKEILFLCEKSFGNTPSVETINILTVGEPEKFVFSFAREREQTVDFSDPLKYLYEPNASIMKAGAFKSVATSFNLKKIQSSTHLYTAEHFVSNFPGRKFLIETFVKPDPAEIRKYLPEGKANVTTRNYPLSPEALKKKTGLKDGGEKFLIGFSGQNKKFLAIAKRL